MRLWTKLLCVFLAALVMITACWGIGVVATPKRIALDRQTTFDEQPADFIEEDPIVYIDEE